VVCSIATSTTDAPSGLALAEHMTEIENAAALVSGRHFVNPRAGSFEYSEDARSQSKQGRVLSEVSGGRGAKDAVSRE
jgi:hypothetical protein